MLQWFRNALAPTLTFAQITDEWLLATEHRLRPSWHSAAARILRREVLPFLGSMPADRIGRRDVTQVIARCMQRGSPSIANHALALIRIVFNWGIASGRLDAAQDPTRGLKKHRLPPRERVLSGDELGRVWCASEGLGDYGRIVRLLMLTGQRRDEMGGLRWTEIEQRPDGPVIALPGSRTKNHRTHIVPLSALALAQLPPRREGYPHLFGRFAGRGFSGWSKAKALLDAQVNGMPHWTLHDLRRSFVTHIAERGLAEPHIIEACVNHISGHKAGVAGTYNRALYSQAKRKALEAWSAELARICCLRQQRAPAAPRPPL
jgi:integrase